MKAKLTDRKVKTAAAGRHMDRTVRGLSLLVWPTGGRSWVLRYQIAGKRREMGLGPYPEVTLAEAREKALDVRRQVKVQHLDPLAERGRAKVLTFKVAGEALIESKRPGWRNAKHRWQWETTLAQLVYPTIGELDCKRIETADVVAVLRPIWATTPETASRVRQRIEAVLGYATAMGARSGDNPARWRGHLDHLLPKPSRVKPVDHLAALDWRAAPAFMAELVKREGIGAKALQFVILTAARSGEVRGMTWAEVDDLDAVWTVPPGRIKAGKEHRVPLTPMALALLGTPGKPAALVFPSPVDPARTLSDANSDRRPRPDGAARPDRTRFPFDVPRLGWRDHGAPTGGDRGGAGAQAQGQGRGRLCPWRPVHQAAAAHGGLGGVPGEGTGQCGSHVG